MNKKIKEIKNYKEIPEPILKTISRKVEQLGAMNMCVTNDKDTGRWIDNVMVFLLEDMPKLIAECERLEYENKGLKQSMDYERTLDIRKHHAYMLLLEQIDKLQRVVACARKLDFKEILNLIIAVEAEFGSDHTKEEEQLGALQQALADYEKESK